MSLNYDIEIDNYYFRILNKNITKYRDNPILLKKYRPIVNINSSTNKDFTENINKFSVYLSNSDLGCFRLCYRYNEQGIFLKGNDYIQSSFIHIKLQEFIHNIFNNLKESDDYFCIEELALNKQNMIEVKEHILDTKRIISIKPFSDNNIYNCGYDVYHNFEYINNKLKQFSDKLKSLYDYDFSNKKLISNIIINNDENLYNIQFYKIKLKLKEQIQEHIDDIILYYCNAKITKFMNKTHESFPIYISLPVFLTTEEGDKITKFGTFNKYILAGNYICKVFDYSYQCSKDHFGKCYGDYKLIGDRYNNIFPLLEIREEIKEINEQLSEQKIEQQFVNDIDIQEKEKLKEKKLKEKLKEEEDRRQIENGKLYASLMARAYNHYGGVIQMINNRCDTNINNIRNSNCNQKILKIQNVYNVRKQLIEDTKRFFNKKLNLTI